MSQLWTVSIVRLFWPLRFMNIIYVDLKAVPTFHDISIRERPSTPRLYDLLAQRNERDVSKRMSDTADPHSYASLTGLVSDHKVRCPQRCTSLDNTIQPCSIAQMHRIETYDPELRHRRIFTSCTPIVLSTHHPPHTCPPRASTIFCFSQRWIEIRNLAPATRN